LRTESLEAFQKHFGRAPTLSATAPGRVNLIGEHTDYSGGLVLPCAIDRELEVLAAAREDDCVRVWARDLDPAANDVTFSCNDEAGSEGFSDYVKAVLCAMRERGLPTRGADLAIASELPRESGLSSSAALCVATAQALLRVAEVEVSQHDVATLAHRAESHFVGTGCGILDPFAVIFGRRDHALRIDCRSLERREIPFPARSLVILIADSGIRRSLAATSRGSVPAYRLRVSECQAAFAAARDAGVAKADATSLRDLRISDLPALEAALDRLHFRRARHVICENARVDAFCHALAQQPDPDVIRVANLLREGQASLRDDFDASTPELDFLCASADALEGVYGSRLTGAGFGGCTLHLVEPLRAASLAQEIADAFEARFGRRPSMLEVRAADGARVTGL